MSQHEVAKGTTVTIHRPDPEEPDDTRWSVIGDLRAPGSDDAGMSDEANYECGDALAGRVGVEIDCEFSCFYAYCVSEEVALELVQAIEHWLVTHRLGSEQP